ncbi:hypothetical protein SAMN04488033_13031 [Salegentibacter agarivorans]|jgi:hypothetical protein|uniref:PH domain-containing protein n=1 Tax=Salegentibacter agarivorans TaxID=345907 RepID=A0A1I2PDT8_9FLAO|nr:MULTISPECIES: DUF3784 domain-containing protein [Salegentibacter]SFG14298.1 hypothetical protein SAMN04488033_13031 [Salegentibacter agarivorans]|tara:strand:- start:1304 stop:1717 length:414 start_codon:yes stop_codon:yes gene_type:complete
MPQISKKVTFFRRNYFFIMGGIWGLMGVLMIIFQVMDVMAYGYTLIGLIYAVVGYLKRDLALEFISWDDEKIEISEWQQSTRSYKWENIDGINVSATNLTIKSGPVDGTMVELKAYTETDIEKLKTELIPAQTLATA